MVSWYTGVSQHPQLLGDLCHATPAHKQTSQYQFVAGWQLPAKPLAQLLFQFCSK